MERLKESFTVENLGGLNGYHAAYFCALEVGTDIEI